MVKRHFADPIHAYCDNESNSAGVHVSISFDDRKNITVADPVRPCSHVVSNCNDVYASMTSQKDEI